MKIAGVPLDVLSSWCDRLSSPDAYDPDGNTVAEVEREIRAAMRAARGPSIPPPAIELHHDWMDEE